MEIKDKKFKSSTSELVEKDINEQERTIVHYITTNGVDRTNEVIDHNKVEDENYKKNPIVLFGHDYDKPIGKSLWLKKIENGIISKTQFAKTPLANEIFSLYKDGFLNAWSIGFIPKGGEFKNDIFHYDQIELLEYSAVSVPANAEALNLEFVKGLKNEELKNLYINDYILNSFQEEINLLKTQLEKVNQTDQTEIFNNYKKETDQKILDITDEINSINKFTSEIMKEQIKNIIVGVIQKQLGKV